MLVFELFVLAFATSIIQYFTESLLANIVLLMLFANIWQYQYLYYYMAIL